MPCVRAVSPEIQLSSFTLVCEMAKRARGLMELCRLRSQGPIAGVRFLGRRQLAPSPTIKGLEERCGLSQRCPARPLNDFSVT